jgi:hypothetical protein
VAISGCAKAGTAAAPDAAPDADPPKEPDPASCKWLHAVNNTTLLKHTQAAQDLRNTGNVSNCFLDMRVLLMAYGLWLVACCLLLIALSFALSAHGKSTST